MIKVLLTGDVCFKVQQEMTAELAKDVLAEMMPYFEAADFRVMNLETPLATEDCGEAIRKSGPNIIGRPQNLGFLETAGCDLAILANNHTGDFGDEALFATLDLLDGHKILHCGAGHDIDEAYLACRVTVKGVKLSFIGVNENEFGVAEFHKAGSAGFDLERLGDKIEEERGVSDKVIVVFHGGNEYNPLPSPLCRERYRTIIRLGADALIGGHTHCIQGYEIYKGKPIVYSMGNFLFKWSNEKSKSWLSGYMTELTIDGDNLSVRPIPYHFEADGSKIYPYVGEGQTAILSYIEKLSSYIGNTEELTRLYKGWCTISGIPYLRAMKYTPDYCLPENVPADIASLRNLLSCEAHNELCRTTLQMAFTGELKDAFEWAKEVKELQILPV